jgi:hypothetical protein
MRKTFAAAVAAALATTGLAAAGPAAAETVWLCKPGKRNDPCSTSLSTTRVSPSGDVRARERPKRVRRPKVDCFYVYPTVSDDRAPQADKSIDPELRSIALYQAARYRQHCRVFAPVYRQITLQGLINPDTVTPEMRATAYGDVREAWRTYLRKHNKGRGVILIGHSQGTFMLRPLVQQEIDTKPRVRRRIVGAYLLGGGVLVPKGRDVGGDFKRVRACRRASQVGCVIAYSLFGPEVPADPRFGRSQQDPNLEVLCNNPANLRRGGSGRLDAIVPSKPFDRGTTMGGLTNQVGFTSPDVSTAWISAPDSYSGQCVTQNGATVLRTAPLNGAPTLRALPDESWGLHLADANLPLGNLLRIARAQIRAYGKR